MRLGSYNLLGWRDYTVPKINLQMIKALIDCHFGQAAEFAAAQRSAALIHSEDALSGLKAE